MEPVPEEGQPLTCGKFSKKFLLPFLVLAALFAAIGYVIWGPSAEKVPTTVPEGTPQPLIPEPVQNVTSNTTSVN